MGCWDRPGMSAADGGNSDQPGSIRVTDTPAAGPPAVGRINGFRPDRLACNFEEATPSTFSLHYLSGETFNRFYVVGKSMKAVILVAGVSKRLLPYTKDIPKCLIQLDDRTIMDYQLSALGQVGVRDIVMVVGYRRGPFLGRLFPAFQPSLVQGRGRWSGYGLF